MHARMLWTLLPLLLAPFVGSFLGVLITRLPANAPVVFARSACPACGTPLAPLDLLPLISFARQRGRCRHCRQTIGWFYPAIELSAVAISVWALLASQTLEQAWLSCVLGWTLLTLGWIDAENFVLPDVLTLPLILVGLGATAMQTPDELFWHASAAALGYLALYSVGIVYRAVRGMDGLGMGDAKLLAAAGAWLGMFALPWVVLSAAIAALFYAGIAAALGRRMRAQTAVPFGPFLAGAIWCVWLYGSALGLK